MENVLYWPVILIGVLVAGFLLYHIVISSKPGVLIATLAAGLCFFNVGMSSVMESTVDLPVMRTDPLTGECVAFEVKGFLVRCTEDITRYRELSTFPGATFQSLELVAQRE